MHELDNATPLSAAAGFASNPRYQANGEFSFGLFWHIDSKSGTIWHGGTTTGFTSAMALHKESGTGVVVLTNSKLIVIKSLAGAILVAVREGEPKPIPLKRRISVAKEVLDSYAGTYNDQSKSFFESRRFNNPDSDMLRRQNRLYSIALRFGYVKCEINWIETGRGGERAAECSFEGSDEMDSFSGFSWAILDGSEITRMITFHHGNKSPFTARKVSNNDVSPTPFDFVRGRCWLRIS